MASERARLGVCRNIPQPDFAIVTSYSNQFAIGTQGNRFDRRRMPGESAQLLTRRWIPQRDCTAPVCRHKSSPVRTKCNDVACNRLQRSAAMTGEHTQLRTCCEIPKLDGPVVPAARASPGKNLSVGTERNRYKPGNGFYSS